MGRRRAEIKRGGPRMVLEKVRREELCCLPSVRSSSLVFSLLNRIFLFFIFCDLNV